VSKDLDIVTEQTILNLLGSRRTHDAQNSETPPPKILRCVIPVVLSNNKSKLMVHMYTVINTTIFLIVRLLSLRYNYMFRPSMLAIFRLYMKHLTISYIYM